MKKNILFLTIFLFASISFSEAQNVIPQPQSFKLQKGFLNTNKYYDDILIDKADIKGGDEAYELIVTPESLMVRYNTPVGLLYAQQTIRQLTDSKGYIPCCEITDYPQFRWRGFMLDVSRHFFPLSYLKEQVDILSRYKINRLHLHLVDAGGWRLEIKRYPRLTQTAAWRTESDWTKWWADGDRRYTSKGVGYGGYYTQDEMRQLVAYADSKGIEIIPEIEMPGHSEELLYAYPELACRYPYNPSGMNPQPSSFFPQSGDICPGNEGVYPFLENVLDEVMQIFPSKYIHIGGDEANMTAWTDCPLCNKKKEELGTTDNHALQTYFINRISDYLESKGRHMIGWDEVVDKGLSKNANVMVWRSADTAKKAADLGCDVIMAPGAWCYFDNDQDAPDTTKNVGMGWLPIEKVYSFNPVAGMSLAQKKHMQGLQANLWTEWVTDTSRCQMLTYPRMLAIAEIGWNGEQKPTFRDWRKTCIKETDSLRSEGINAFDLSQEQGERSETRTYVFHKARGCKVIYNQPYSEHYRASGDSTLTDGKRGGWLNNDGRWQGFIKPLDVTLDLGHKTFIHSISMEFMHINNAWIWMPKDLKYSVSSDGKNWETVYTHSEPFDERQGLKYKTLTWKGSYKKVRFIRIEGTAQKDGGWIFTDEIIVR